MERRPSRIGEQLSLWSDEEYLKMHSAYPWSGRSPRGLTYGAKALFLSQGAQKSMRESGMCECGRQLSLADQEGPPIYRGAPSLLPLPKGEHDG